MSVYKRDRGESSVEFLETARLLEIEVLDFLIRCPKRYTFLLATQTMALASAVHDHVRAANNTYPTNAHEVQLRRDEWTYANNALQNLGPKLSLLYGAVMKNPKGFEWVDKAMTKIGGLMADEAKLISKMKKSDKDRYAKLLG